MKAFDEFENSYGPNLPPERISDKEGVSKEINKIAALKDTIGKNVDNASKLELQINDNIKYLKNAINIIKDNMDIDCQKARDDRNTALKYVNEKIASDANLAKKNADAADENYKTAKSLVSNVKTSESKLKTIDPPIASVGQTVQFIVNYGGNVTPTWTFVRFKGPNAPLFGAQGTRTHILNISVGPAAAPSPGGPTAAPGFTRAPSGFVQQSQINLLLTTLLPARPF